MKPVCTNCGNKKKRTLLFIGLFVVCVCGLVWEYKSDYIMTLFHRDNQIVTTNASYGYNINAVERKNDCKEMEKRDYKLLRDMNSSLYEDHQHNYNVFVDLIKNGCPENFVKHKKYAEREISIIAQTKDSYNHETNSTCMLIEKSLKPSLILDIRDCNSWKCALDNAEIYLKLMKYGCTENLEKNKTMFVRELKLVLALLNKADIDSNHNNVVNRLSHIYEMMGLQSESNSLKLRYPRYF